MKRSVGDQHVCVLMYSQAIDEDRSSLNKTSSRPIFLHQGDSEKSHFKIVNLCLDHNRAISFIFFLTETSTRYSL